MASLRAARGASLLVGGIWRLRASLGGRWQTGGHVSPCARRESWGRDAAFARVHLPACGPNLAETPVSRGRFIPAWTKNRA